MKQNEYKFSYEVYDAIDELNEDDRYLLNKAREATQNAWAPYSRFRVGAVARLKSGTLVMGANQENASYPAGICAERVLLSSAGASYPGDPIETMAVSYEGDGVVSDHPISPCGICRQTLQEFEQRTHHPVRLILAGKTGKVYIIPSAGMLLPLAFTGDELV
ncbi:cytidine deaminase [Pseudoflavitalea sp. X16]|uniref:cytidine deaminase n=1 Tax=Paraflavitalea devenefica TaxID=2716334 RepID=UPI001420B668|nr:cytidine deaminase [Paraflavitalea devenefica]NII26840.1 cytidine deaminase [Paraflavitalea devenefica]